MSEAKKKETPEKRVFRGSRAKSVAVYLVALFIIAMLLLILAYFTQERMISQIAAQGLQIS